MKGAVDRGLQTSHWKEIVTSLIVKSRWFVLPEHRDSELK